MKYTLRWIDSGLLAERHSGSPCVADYVSPEKTPAGALGEYLHYLSRTGATDFQTRVTGDTSAQVRFKGAESCVAIVCERDDQ